MKYNNYAKKKLNCIIRSGDYPYIQTYIKVYLFTILIQIRPWELCSNNYEYLLRLLIEFSSFPLSSYDPHLDLNRAKIKLLTLVQLQRKPQSTQFETIQQLMDLIEIDYEILAVFARARVLVKHPLRGWQDHVNWEPYSLVMMGENCSKLYYE